MSAFTWFSQNKEMSKESLFGFQETKTFTNGLQKLSGVDSR